VRRRPAGFPFCSHVPIIRRDRSSGRGSRTARLERRHDRRQRSGRRASDRSRARLPRPRASLRRVARILRRWRIPIDNPADFFAPNVVKVVCKANGDAMYFSRAPIPFARDHFAQDKDRDRFLPGCRLRHIGLYAYRASFLRAYAKLTPSPVEGFEALEQLRALWHGYRISVSFPIICRCPASIPLKMRHACRSGSARTPDCPTSFAGVAGFW
jgi:hypothetical protein